jgi:hypothetical protein
VDAPLALLTVASVLPCKGAKKSTEAAGDVTTADGPGRVNTSVSVRISRN